MPRRKRPSSDSSLEARHALRADAEAGRLSWSDGIRRMRKSMGMTQADFAKRFRLTVRQLSEIETGAANPTVATLSRLGKLFA